MENVGRSPSSSKCRCSRTAARCAVTASFTDGLTHVSVGPPLVLFARSGGCGSASDQQQVCPLCRGLRISRPLGKRYDFGSDPFVDPAVFGFGCACSYTAGCKCWPAPVRGSPASSTRPWAVGAGFPGASCGAGGLFPWTDSLAGRRVLDLSASVTLGNTPLFVGVAALVMAAPFCRDTAEDDVAGRSGRSCLLLRRPPSRRTTVGVCSGCTVTRRSGSRSPLAYLFVNWAPRRSASSAVGRTPLSSGVAATVMAVSLGHDTEEDDVARWSG